ncbi:DUF1134 domain-containing protein [Salinarimonas ramus]|uniref:DUF1134 domain-containing protein n=1 Tax=Salinarimonas ramus TaxID=690164 RepID=A0A917V6Y2_9HYPH|nr:DUF1134 domain-containing protein [Salinarimonas ramus]GGK44825.1 hypothetical protein GCM10011322_35010 [Salinarimonas ramus]
MRALRQALSSLAIFARLAPAAPALPAILALVAALVLVVPGIAAAQQSGQWATNPQIMQETQTYTTQETIEAGHRFFGSTSRGIALAIEQAAARWGQPNGYILGQEASGAFFGGLRYGEGVLYTRNAGQRSVFWQGPSLGFDVGGDGARTMMLVYNLPATDALYRRFVGVDGSAYLVGGVGMTALMADQMVVVPIRTGVGARLGINLGYLKFTDQPTWNPF